MTDLKLLPSTNCWHAWTVKKCIFIFFSIMGKVFFTPHFQKQLEQFGIHVQKMPPPVKDCQILSRKVKQLGKGTSHWKSLLKMETLVQFQLPITSIIMSSESEKYKSSLSSGHSGCGLKASQFQSLGKLKDFILMNTELKSSRFWFSVKSFLYSAIF